MNKQILSCTLTYVSLYWELPPLFTVDFRFAIPDKTTWFVEHDVLHVKKMGGFYEFFRFCKFVRYDIREN